MFYIILYVLCECGLLKDVQLYNECIYYEADLSYIVSKYNIHSSKVLSDTLSIYGRYFLKVSLRINSTKSFI